MIRATLIFIGALFSASAFAGEKIGVDLGVGGNWSKGADAAFVRYSEDIKFPNYPKLPAFYEFSLGAWENKHDNSAVGLAIGIRHHWDKFHVEASGGPAYAFHKTHLSGTHEQFILRIGAAYRLDKIEFGIFKTHYSNAKPIFDWNGRNVGYDFITFQVGYLMK